jgi:hypothetical protein
LYEMNEPLIDEPAPGPPSTGIQAAIALMDSALKLLEHKKNTSVPDFGCPACGSIRGTVAGLQYHLKNRVCLRASMRDAGMERAGKTFVCSHCSRKYISSVGYSQHLRSSPACSEVRGEDQGAERPKANLPRRRKIDDAENAALSETVESSSHEAEKSSRALPAPLRIKRTGAAHRRQSAPSQQSATEYPHLAEANPITLPTPHVVCDLPGFFVTRAHLVESAQLPPFLSALNDSTRSRKTEPSQSSPPSSSAALPAAHFYAKALWDAGLPASSDECDIDVGPSHTGVSRLPAVMCGGPVWGLDVLADGCDTVTTTGTRVTAWIAVSAHAPHRTLHSPGAVVSSPDIVHRNALQIWSIDKSTSPFLPGVARPRLYIVHDCDSASALAWSPHARPNSQAVADFALKRIGVLAAAMGDGCVRIFAVPHPDNFSASGVISIHLIPSAVYDLRSMGGATCLSWHATIPGLLVAGLGCGAVATLDVSAVSSASSVSSKVCVPVPHWALGFCSPSLSTAEAPARTLPMLLAPLALYVRGADAALGPLSCAVRCVSWNPLQPSQFAAGYLSGRKYLWSTACFDSPLCELPRANHSVSRAAMLCFSSSPLL